MKMYRWVTVIFVVILSFFSIIGSGGGGGSGDTDTGPVANPNDVIINGVPRIETTVQNSCASRAITQLLQQKGVPVEFEDVFDRVGLPPFSYQDGCYGVKSWVRSLGYEMNYVRQGTKEEIINLISNGILVMVVQMYSHNDWTGHNRVVMGYNLNDQIFILEDDGLPPRYRIKMDVFMDLWIRGAQELGWPGPPLWYLLPR